MADSTYGFRTALSGFHKGDVTGFIEKMATQHRAELLEYEQTIITLREENRSLQQQLNLLMMATPLTKDTPPAPKEEPVPAPQPVADPIPDPVPAPAPAPREEPADLMSLELQAYRRAEEAERYANTRVKKLYRQMGELCEEAMEEFSVTDVAVKQTVEQILSQAKDLERSYSALSDALLASRERLAAMSNLLGEGFEK